MFPTQIHIEMDEPVNDNEVGFAVLGIDVPRVMRKWFGTDYHLDDRGHGDIFYMTITFDGRHSVASCADIASALRKRRLAERSKCAA